MRKVRPDPTPLEPVDRDEGVAAKVRACVLPPDALSKADVSRWLIAHAKTLSSATTLANFPRTQTAIMTAVRNYTRQQSIHTPPVERGH